jgi:hypothetical protein
MLSLFWTFVKIKFRLKKSMKLMPQLDHLAATYERVYILKNSFQIVNEANICLKIWLWFMHQEIWYLLSSFKSVSAYTLNYFYNTSMYWLLVKHGLVQRHFLSYLIKIWKWCRFNNYTVSPLCHCNGSLRIPTSLSWCPLVFSSHNFFFRDSWQKSWAFHCFYGYNLSSFIWGLGLLDWLIYFLCAHRTNYIIFIYSTQ